MGVHYLKAPNKEDRLKFTTFKVARGDDFTNHNYLLCVRIEILYLAQLLLPCKGIWIGNRHL